MSDEKLEQIMEHWLEVFLEGKADNWYKDINPYPQHEDERIRVRQQLGVHPLHYLNYQGWLWKEVVILNGKACALVLLALMKREGFPAIAMRIIMAYFFPDEYQIWHRSVMSVETAEGMHNLRFEPSSHSLAVP